MLITDRELTETLSSISDLLAGDGEFIFETRNPQAHAWENWDVEYSGQVVDTGGSIVSCVCNVEVPVAGDLVHFSHTFSSAKWSKPEVSRSSLRFLDVDSMDSFLHEADLTTTERFGDWDQSVLLNDSPEIISVTRRT